MSDRTIQQEEILRKLELNPEWLLIQRYRDSVVTQAINSHDEKIKKMQQNEIDKLFDRGLFYVLFRYFDYKRNIK